MAFDQIIHVASVHDPFVPAVRPMDVVRWVRATLVVRRAAILIGCAYFQLVFVHVIAVNIVQMTFVKTVDVTVMPDSRVAAIGPPRRNLWVSD